MTPVRSHTTSSAALALGILLAATLAPAGARAAGYDTPILYTAKHMGMGGTAIGSVDDGSALFHNPAGLSGIWKGNFIADISLLTGTIKANPTDGKKEKGSIESEPTMAPLFLLGGGFRISEMLTAGLAVYPVASAGGEYKYESLAGSQWVDGTTLVFFEASPGLSLELPGGLRIGAGYRVNFVSLSRTRGEPDTLRDIDLAATGLNYAGYRVGLQWRPNPNMGLGMVYRSKTTTKVEASSANFLNQCPLELFDDQGHCETLTTSVKGDHNLSDLSTEFVHAAKLGFGLRVDLLSIGLAQDLEYTFGSQVKSQTFKASYVTSGESAEIPQLARWSDNITSRTGLEYRLSESESGQAAIRLGYVYDGRVGNPDYPTAFGTPPTATHSYTVGGGWDAGPWELNLAWAYRNGSTPVEIASDADSCAACGRDGDYEITLMGYYLDFSYDFE